MPASNQSLNAVEIDTDSEHSPSGRRFVSESESSRSLGTLLIEHMVKRHNVAMIVATLTDSPTNGKASQEIEKELKKALSAERKARSDVLCHPVDTMMDVARKAIHVRALHLGGKPDFDDADWQKLLRSFIPV
jgi:hypothetical protein